jgi:hypothetical protein
VAESGSAFAQAARECEVAERAMALAYWIGDGSRPVTPRQVLGKPDVAAAAEAIGVTAPELLRSAADVPALHRSARRPASARRWAVPCRRGCPSAH